jgi:tRNA isopentenyl-2-thiomethyl-A-37 hydroxylase MiaE
MISKEIEKAYTDLLKDESYTWEELAELFCHICEKEDIDEFIDMLFEHKGIKEDGKGF